MCCNSFSVGGLRLSLTLGFGSVPCDWEHRFKMCKNCAEEQMWIIFFLFRQGHPSREVLGVLKYERDPSTTHRSSPNPFKSFNLHSDTRSLMCRFVSGTDEQHDCSLLGTRRVVKLQSGAFEINNFFFHVFIRSFILISTHGWYLRIYSSNGFAGIETVNSLPVGSITTAGQYSNSEYKGRSN